MAADPVKSFLDCLDDAGALLEQYPGQGAAPSSKALNYSPSEQFSLAVIDQWPDLVEISEPPKPLIRIVQHMACAGGTLMCKCLASLPNVALLSEVNPRSKLQTDLPVNFAPTDVIALATKSEFPLLDELVETLFRTDIGVVSRHLHDLGKHLVIREHSHSDFMYGDTVADRSTVRSFLEGDHPLACILTVRHPADSFLSLADRGWVKFSPATFDEYCRRYLVFLDRNRGLPIFHYEAFVSDPGKVTRNMSDALDLPFNEDFLDMFDLFGLTGDSGRSSDVIAPRERRVFDLRFRHEADTSEHYPKLCETLGYNPPLDSEPLARQADG